MRYRWLPIAGALFLVIAMAIQFFVSYQWEKKKVIENIDSEIKLAQKDFIFEIYDIQDAGEDMREYILRHLDKPDKIMHETGSILKRYPDVLGCYVSFRAGYYDEDDIWYCPCAYRLGDSIVQEMYGDAQHDYFQRRWYRGALESDVNGYWSPSYRDEDFKEPICTHSVPVYPKGVLPDDDDDDDDDDEKSARRCICVVGLDFSMQWVDQMLEEIKPFDDACCILYSTDGTVMLTSDNMGTSTVLGDDLIIRESLLEPMGMKLEIGVPKRHVWEAVRGKSMLTLIMLLIGLGVAALLIRRILIDHEDYSRVETVNRLMEQELRIASEIQQSILRVGNRTRMTHPWQDVELGAMLIPMREVGGDLYDFYRDGENLYFIIGDVSGKSVPAAMFMSATVNLFRSAVRRLRSPKAIMEEMNSVLSDNNPSMMFVTAIIGRLHVPTGQLIYCNAAHLSPIKVNSHNSTAEDIELIPNIPMGYDGHFRYVEQGLMLGEGDSIVLYTDGITEARNAKREMLGFARWREIISRQAESLHCSDLLEDVKAFMVDTVPTDDITLMIIKKTSGGVPVEVRVENKIDQWPALRTALHEYGVCVGMENRPLKKMEIALEEAVVNIVNYSKATWIALTLSHQPSAIRIQLSDNGVPFDPTAQEEKDIEKAIEERQIGGLGIALVKQIADELTYHRNGEKNELIIIKNI